MDKDKINRIREISILSVLGIKNTGRRVSIRCVFHNEKTASLTIYTDNSYYCYGCKANGSNAIDFLMALGMNFTEAIKELDRL